MKPELVTLGYGAHNEGIEASFQRIYEGATWKKQRIIVVLPASEMIPAKVALSHWSLLFPPNQPVVRMLALGQEVGEAYSNTVEAILGHPELSTWEYVLTIEHDNIPPPDGVLQLIKRMDQHPELACIGGLYWTKGEGGVPQIWGDPKDPIPNYRPQPAKPGELVECCGTGMGFNLWRIAMFKDPKLPKPLFQTKSSIEGLGTQDLAFWAEARKHGYRCAVDCAVLVGHYDAGSGMTW
jgi:hypothetical protein